MATLGTPQAEVTVDEALLRGLLCDQMPEFAVARIELLDAGWDNLSFRVGDEHIARMPRRASAIPLLASEQKWLPILAPRLPIAVPVPVAVGVPGRTYPWAWSLLPFIPGHTADIESPSSDQANRFAQFLSALHQPAPADAPENPFRGVPVINRVENVEERLTRLRQKTDSITPRIEKAWQAALETEPARESVWLHGDLHARNVLIERGRFSGIIDWGDITSGDAATDLAAVWMLFEDKGDRRRALDAYGISHFPDALYIRAKGWAILFGAMLLDSGLIDHPRHATMGQSTLARVHADG